jgi:hypothetical protein
MVLEIFRGLVLILCGILQQWSIGYMVMGSCSLVCQKSSKQIKASFVRNENNWVC